MSLYDTPDLPALPKAPAYVFRDDRNAQIQAKAKTDTAMAKAGGGPFGAPSSAAFDSFKQEVSGTVPNPFAPKGAFAPATVSAASARQGITPTAGAAPMTAQAPASQAREWTPGPNAGPVNALQPAAQPAPFQASPGPAAQTLTPEQSAAAAAPQAQPTGQGAFQADLAGAQGDIQKILDQQAAAAHPAGQAAPAGTPGQPAGTGNALQDQVNAAISRLLANPTGAYDQQTALARENAIKGNQQAKEDLRGQAATEFLPGSGQGFTPIQKQSAEQQLAMRDFDAKAAAGRTAAEQQGIQTAVQLAQPQLQQQFEAGQNALNRTLQLDIQGNQNSFQAAQQKAAQAFDSAMQQSGFNHDTAMQASNQVFQQEMQKAGFSQEQILQATQLSQQMNIAQQQMHLQESMHMADLAQSDHQFGQKLGLDYAQLATQKEQFTAQLSQNASQFAKQFGLTEKQVTATLKSQDFQNQMEKIGIAMQLTQNNPAAMAPFAEQLSTIMAKALGMTDAQIAQGKVNNLAANYSGSATGKTDFSAAALKQGYSQAQVDEALGKWDQLAPNSGGASGTATAGTLQNGIDKFNSMKDSLPTNVNGDNIERTLTAMANPDSLKTVLNANDINLHGLGDLPGFEANFKPVPKTATSYSVKYGSHTGLSDGVIPTQEGSDYLRFIGLTKNGLTEKQAFDIASTTIGADRVKKAYKAMTGKDWGAA